MVKSLTGSFLFAANTWWNHLFESRVGPLVWDLGMISRALMNVGHAHSLVSATQKQQGMWGCFVINKPLTYIKCL